MEFLALVLGLSVVSTFALPALLRPRLLHNEKAAAELLAMLVTSQQAWEAETGSRASLIVLAGTVDHSEGTPLPRALMPLGFSIHQDFSVVRAGYRFRQVRERSGRPIGAWATPKTPSYSGKRVFYADFDLAQVQEIRGLPDGVEFDKDPPDESVERVPLDLG